MNDFSFTVGIPFYQKSDPLHFEEAIDSIMNQTLMPSEIHLIQDGAVGKNLQKVVNKYENHPSKLFKIIKLNKMGLPYALNKSIENSSTKFYARMDADDISFAKRFEKQINYLKIHNNVKILGSWAYEFEKDINETDMFLNKTPNSKNSIERLIHYRNPLIHSTVIFKIQTLRKIGLYNESMLTDQDLELWNRAIKKNVNITNLQEPLLYLRTLDRIHRRSKWSAIKRQIIIRYSYNTSSLSLNFLKLASILIRIMPVSIRKWSYTYLRNK